MTEAKEHEYEFLYKNLESQRQLQGAADHAKIYFFQLMESKDKSIELVSKVRDYYKEKCTQFELYRSQSDLAKDEEIKRLREDNERLHRHKNILTEENGQLNARFTNARMQVEQLESDLSKAKELLRHVYTYSDYKQSDPIDSFLKGEQSTVKPEQSYSRLFDSFQAGAISERNKTIDEVLTMIRDSQSDGYLLPEERKNLETELERLKIDLKG